MEIKVYQINISRDKEHVAFIGMRELHNSSIDSSVYDVVYEGTVNCETLNDVFMMFNVRQPKGYKGRSLSVSDVVEVITPEDKKGFYFVDTFDFCEVDFNSAKAKKPDSNKGFGHGCYVSVWDDGETEIQSEVVYDRQTHEIVEFKDRDVSSEDDGIAEDSVDSIVEILEDEYIITETGEQFPVEQCDEQPDDHDLYWYQ